MFDPKEQMKTWLPIHWGYYEKFIKSQKGKMDEEEYIKKHLAKNGPDYWFEIYKLQEDMVTYGGVLRNVSLTLRRRMLLNIAGTNFSREKIYRSYALTKPKMLAFINNDDRRMNSFGIDRIGKLAVLCRVPLLWLENEVIDDDIWDTEYIRYTVHKRMNKEEFIAFFEGRSRHDIQGVILQIGHLIYYLRVEYDRDSFIVEILNKEIKGQQLKVLFDLIGEKFHFDLGFAKTVIPTQENPVICFGHSIPPYPYITFIK